MKDPSQRFGVVCRRTVPLNRLVISRDYRWLPSPAFTFSLKVADWPRGTLNDFH